MSQHKLTDYKTGDGVNGGEGNPPDDDSDDTTETSVGGISTDDGGNIIPTGEELPTTDAIPPKCLSFTISSPFAHFRKVETSSTRLTYGIPPRTTVNGLLAAILGLDRDSYYDVFNLTHSAVSINIANPLREYQMPIKHRTTDPDQYNTAGSKARLKVQYPQHPEEIESGKHHQRVAHTMLRDAAYRVDVWLSTDELYDRLKAMLSAGESHYTPSLGLSECLASIEYHGEYTPDPITTAEGETVVVDSAIPQSSATIPAQSDTSVTTEQVPAEMRRVENPFPSRRTTGYTAYQFDTDGSSIPAVTDVAATVGEQTVIFR